MTIFIDNNCKCHVTNPEGDYRKITAPEQFNGKCPAYIEGFCVRPDGVTWTNEDGKIFGPAGEMMWPWRDLALLEEFQRQYEAQLAAAAAAYTEGVNSI